jgi:hypothetical protein
MFKVGCFGAKLIDLATGSTETRSMFRLLPFLFVLLIAPLAACAQDTTHVREADIPKWQFGVNGGLARRLFRSGMIRDADTQKYMEDLKNGYSFGADFTYFVWPKVGFGLVYDHYLGKATSADSLTENVTIQHLSAAFTYRSFFKNNKTSVQTSFLTGYQPYTNKTSYLGQNLTFNGKTMGWGIRVSLNHRIAPKLALSLTGTAMMGAIYRLQRKSELGTTTLHLYKDNQVDLSRASITFGISFM